MAPRGTTVKLGQQKFRKRRGSFQPFSEKSHNHSQDQADGVGRANHVNPNIYVAPQLRKFWSENLRPARSGTQGSSRQPRATIPEEKLGFFDYKGHAATLGLTEEEIARHRRDRPRDMTLQNHLLFLNSIFPGVRFISSERELVRQKIRELLIAHNQENELFASVCLSRSANVEMRLFFNGKRDCFYLVERDRSVIRTSITYGSADRAKAVLASQRVTWYAARTFHFE